MFVLVYLLIIMIVYQEKIAGRSRLKCFPRLNSKNVNLDSTVVDDIVLLVVVLYAPYFAHTTGVMKRAHAPRRAVKIVPSPAFLLCHYQNCCEILLIRP